MTDSTARPEEIPGLEHDVFCSLTSITAGEMSQNSKTLEVVANSDHTR